MSNSRKPSGRPGYRLLKRTFDIIGAILLMLPVGLVIGVSAIVIKAEDKGPVFYMATRNGRYGKPFQMVKLRSMKVDAPDIRLADGSTYNGDDDPRVTRFGRFARKTSIDELPQVINILKGDMSFIGPRPDTPVGMAAYTEEEKLILTVRPGVTGYNQAIHRNAVLTKEKLQNDLYYVRHLSIGFDIRILFLTIAAVLGHKNINRVNVDKKDAYILRNDGTKDTTEDTINGTIEDITDIF